MGESAFSKYPVALMNLNDDMEECRKIFKHDMGTLHSGECEQVLYSSEFFENIHQSDLIQVRDFLSNYFDAIDIVIITRRPAERMCSALQQAIKIGLASYWTEMEEICEPINTIFAKFTAVFGASNVYHHLIDPTSGLTGIAQFFKPIVAIDLIESFVPAEDTINASVSINAAFLLNAYSMRYPLLRGRTKPNPRRANNFKIIEQLLASTPGEKFSIPTEIFTTFKKFVLKDQSFFDKLYGSHRLEDISEFHGKYSLEEMATLYPPVSTNFFLDALVKIVERYDILDQNARLTKAILQKYNGSVEPAHILANIENYSHPDCIELAARICSSSQKEIKQLVDELYR